MASNKRKQDEKHLKILREIVALSHNKQCFDCHQRGPTYINMTIGSFVCTACSGLLRGLNPPHRVKSISMASFTPEEMDFIKSHGNEFCRKVWLGLYDNRIGSQSESRDETKVKDFMVQKYERKRYYVAPTETMKEEAKKMNESAISKAPGTKPLKSLLGENAPKLQVGQEDQAPGMLTFTDEPDTNMNIHNSNVNIHENPFSSEVGSVASVCLATGTDATPTNTNMTTNQDLFSDGVSTAPPVVEEPKTVSATPPPIGSTPQSPGNQSIQSSKSSGSTAMDLLGDLGGDPFASSAPAQPQGGFADFGNFGTAASQATAFPQSAPLQPAGSNVPAHQQAFNGFGAPTSTPAAPAPSAGGDKYSNLSDLFSMAPEQSESTSSSGWSSTVNTPSGGMNWNSSSSTNPPSAGINWGGESTSSSSAGGVNWNSSSVPGTSAVGWGGASTASWGTPTTAQSNGLGVPGNPFLHSNVSNPFGGSSNTSLTSQSSAGIGRGAQPVANPFGTQPGGVQPGGGAQPGGFGAFGTPQSTASQQGGFGQFGAPNTAVSSGAGFGQMGMQNGGFGMPQTTSSAGFGQGFGGAQPGFGQQPQQPQQGAGFGAMPGAGFGGQPGFGAQPGGFGGQQMQGFGAPQQQAGGWGQPASSATVNPFMSTAQQQQYSAPKTGATNPFL